MPHCFWEKFLIEGEESYNYMINNFQNIFDDGKIKHFIIEDIQYNFYYEVEELNAKYLDDIEKELIPWIRKEYEDQRLFQRNYWKPFGNQYEVSYMVLGYKKMFQYKQYYFQFAVDARCGESNNCKYCKKKEYIPHFVLALYGWKDETHDKLQPDDAVIIPNDNIMPEYYWDAE